ncbi:UbiX family flavin prenyltransferase [Streptomyces albulus]|nr:UbiX family flavin prenyltransferase [Streptomyces noursei]
MTAPTVPPDRLDPWSRRTTTPARTPAPRTTAPSWTRAAGRGSSGLRRVWDAVRRLRAARVARGREAVDLVVSRASRLTLMDETRIAFRTRTGAATCGSGWRAARTASRTPSRDRGGAGGVRYWPAGDLAAGPSSGSYPAKGMVIVPASTACVAGVALGLSKDLLQRVASVTLKERRPLVVAVRETPLNGQTLKHLVALDEAGAVVLPASPAFYAGATHIQDLVDFVAGRVLDAAQVPHGLYRRWEGELGGGSKGEAPKAR